MRRSTIRIVTAVAVLLTYSLLNPGAVVPATARSQAISTVRSILKRNAALCRITKTTSITAAQVKAGWRVTAKVVMVASGAPRNEMLVWTVTSNNAVPASQLASEVANGCP